MANYDEYCSKVNRQDLPVKPAAQAYMEAKAREMDRHERERFSTDPYPTYSPDSQEMKDWRIIRRYESNFGFEDRGTSTFDRGEVFEE